MKRIVLGLLLILSAALPIAAQNAADPCAYPDISTTSQTLSIGAETVSEVKTQVDLKERTVTYHWTVKGGRIIDGQGTKSIKLIRESTDLLITVEGHVLPENCKFRAVDSSIICLPEPILVNQFETNPEAIEQIHLNQFFNDLKANPTDQGFISLRRDESLKRLLFVLVKNIKQSNFDLSRISLMISQNKAEPV